MRRLVWSNGPRIPSLVLYAVFALALLGGMLAVFRNLESERRERAQVELTNEILLALRVHGRALIDAETGQRGYILTGDPDYLAPYYDGTRAWRQSQDRLEQLLATIATPQQRDLLQRADSVGTQKLSEMARTVAMVEQGRPDQARAWVMTDQGRQLMVRYRAINGELEAIERDILARTMADARRSEGRLLPILTALSLVMVAALVLGLWQTFRMAEAEAEARMSRSLAEARDRADLLSRELNHRVKNLFAVIIAIVRMSLRGEKDPEAAARKITERINALSVAHSVTQGELQTAVAGLEDLVRTSVAPYVTSATQLAIAGSAVQVPARQITPLGLILHELVTNCVKYGAWSARGGALAVTWEVTDGEVSLEWRESTIAPIEPAGEEGFGTRMIAAAARQLDGRVERRFGDNEMVLQLQFPVSAAIAPVESASASA